MFLHAALCAAHIEVGRNCWISLGHCPDPRVATYLKSLRQRQIKKVSAPFDEYSRAMATLWFADRLLQLPIWSTAQHDVRPSSQLQTCSQR